IVETADKVQTETTDQNNQLNTTSIFKPSYPGIIEIVPNKDGFLVINEVNIDDYLLYVVPSEVPYSAGYEGYKAQTIAARTYAVSDMLIGRFEKYGFHVDDSTYSQVYNSQPTNDLVRKAVAETAGLVMTYDNKIIDAKYYSTSCGFGASYDEVWPEKEKNTKPYLTFNNYSSTNISSLKNDSDALTFFKDWTITAIDSASPYFRWKYSLTAKQLNSTINDKIYDIYKNNKNNFKQKWILDFYKPASISEEGIGTIKDIYINDHSESGLVNEMIIVTDKGTFKITGSSIIKRLLTPIDPEIKITRLRGEVLKNVDSLPSPFFSIDRDFKQTTLTGITVYGGGYGHGVGMSQYGLIESSRIGKSYDTILKTFYKDIEFKNISDIKID
ncbi:MAG: SpoIID/LytB domain-containing protein, partial [Clostridiales bacterium]|nr:SpoIID/LytB domain-containing protein [Clostridiales bacterium]